MTETIDIDGIARQIAAELANNETPRGVWPDHRLRKWARNGGVVVRGNPEYKAKIGPGSIDLALDGTIRRPRWWWNPLTRRIVWSATPKAKRDIRKKTNIDLYWAKQEYFKSHEIWPKKCALLSTLEWVNVPSDALGIVRIRSTTGRYFLEAMDAGVVDPGFSGNLTLEFFNPAPWPTDIYENGFYVQMVMFDLSSAADNPYDGRYQNQFGLTPGKAEKV